MRNVSNSRDAGPRSPRRSSCSASCSPASAWAHLDIAGMAWGKGNETTPKGATAYGVRPARQSWSPTTTSADAEHMGAPHMATEVNFYHLTKSSLEGRLAPPAAQDACRPGERARRAGWARPSASMRSTPTSGTHDPNGFPAGTVRRATARPSASRCG